MSASNEWTNWHLTPQGWEKGSRRLDHEGTTKFPAPDDRVLTVRYEEYLGSLAGKADIGHTEIWRSKDEKTIAKLIEVYGKAPNQL